MSFNRVLGQDLAKQIIQKALLNGSVAHAYLFYGPESIGKKLAAVEFAKALNCQVSGPADGCDECPSCRKIEQGTHPDFFFLEPTKTSSSAREGAIRIEDVRELQRRLNFLPYEGKTKVAVVDSAELMNPQAGNSFLKTLEEPPSNTVLILIASNPRQLLPTIVSRCQGIRFQPLRAGEIKRILRLQEGLEPEEIELRTAQSMGQVEKALNVDTARTDQLRRDLVEMIGTVSHARVDAVFAWSRTCAKQSDSIPEVLDQLTVLLRDLAFLKARDDAALLHNKDLAGQLKPLAARKTLPAILKMAEAAERTRRALQGNANAQLALENMLLAFCDAA
ncbi:MAG: DNA polymerase III subunit delta' [Nitrospinae bacterium]|nr:DNA polymerase III subunit delta' [Nitrospinota bacterium]